jgi:hypothetical protein
MAGERLRVEVTRSGGFAGISRTGTVDTGDLDEGRAEMLRTLVDQCRLEIRPETGRREAGGADRFQYGVTIVRDGQKRSIVLREPDLSEAQERLIRWVLKGDLPER